ncbi:MAG: cation:proton antiporter [Bacteroidetes bacterium]|nr:cation:proton antiporter [Bacteroidota bacterium]
MIEYLIDLLHQIELPVRNPVLILSLLFFIILLVPFLFRRFHIPGILGLILSGVLIGPNGLNILEKSDAINLFSTIGLLYIMFMAGLELDTNEFNKYKYKSLLFGLFTFSVPLMVGFPICFYVLKFDFQASFLVASMFSTHTLISYPIVSRWGIVSQQAVAITVGGTILTDTAVLIMLAVILKTDHNGVPSSFWLQLILSLTLFSFVMFKIIPPVSRWFFRKVESEKHSHYIFVLAVIFFAAFLSEIAGVEPIIGAFMAGLALNSLISHTSALFNRIEFIGNALFIPFFLISVGMLVDISVLFNGNHAVIIAIVLTSVALIVKWLAAWLTQLTFSYNSVHRRLIFGLSSSHAAATLAIILVGYDAKILDENTLNATIILILITCVVSSLVTERAARELLIKQGLIDQHLNRIDQQNVFEKYLLPISNQWSVNRFLELSVIFRKNVKHIPLHVLQVVPADFPENELDKDDEFTLNLKKTAAELDTPVSFHREPDFHIASGISRVANQVDAHYILLGWPQKSGLIDRVFGEILDNVLDTATQHLVVCRLQLPLVAHQKLIISLPPLAFTEPGFTDCFKKWMQLSLELHLDVVIFCTQETKSYIKKLSASNYNFKNWKFKVTDLNQNWFRSLEDYKTNKEDLLVLMPGRPASASFLLEQKEIPLYIEERFPENSVLLFYSGDAI